MKIKTIKGLHNWELEDISDDCKQIGSLYDRLMNPGYTEMAVTPEELDALKGVLRMLRKRRRIILDELGTRSPDVFGSDILKIKRAALAGEQE